MRWLTYSSVEDMHPMSDAAAHCCGCCGDLSLQGTFTCAQALQEHRQQEQAQQQHEHPPHNAVAACSRCSNSSSSRVKMREGSWGRPLSPGLVRALLARAALLSRGRRTSLAARATADNLTGDNRVSPECPALAYQGRCWLAAAARATHAALFEEPQADALWEVDLTMVLQGTDNSRSTHNHIGGHQTVFKTGASTKLPSAAVVHKHITGQHTDLTPNIHSMLQTSHQNVQIGFPRISHASGLASDDVLKCHQHAHHDEAGAVSAGASCFEVLPKKPSCQRQTEPECHT
jgi:hypothetical protein